MVRGACRQLGYVTCGLMGAGEAGRPHAPGARLTCSRPYTACAPRAARLQATPAASYAAGRRMQPPQRFGRAAVAPCRAPAAELRVLQVVALLPRGGGPQQGLGVQKLRSPDVAEAIIVDVDTLQLDLRHSLELGVPRIVVVPVQHVVPMVHAHFRELATELGQRGHVNGLRTGHRLAGRRPQQGQEHRHGQQCLSHGQGGRAIVVPGRRRALWRARCAARGVSAVAFGSPELRRPERQCMGLEARRAANHYRCVRAARQHMARVQ